MPVRYLLGRLLQALATLFIVSVLAFLVPRLVPGDPALQVLGPLNFTPEKVAAVRAQMGLDQPMLQQYAHFLGGALHFDFGESLRTKDPVAPTMLDALVPSLAIVLLSIMLAVLIAVPLGVYAAVKRNRAGDHTVRFLGVVGYATPSFLVGLVLVLVFSVNLAVLPVQGYGEGFVGHLQSLVLPVVTVAFAITPLFVRTLRSALINTLTTDFIEAARARGLSGQRVLYRHALRVSLLPTVTLIGLSIGGALSFTVVVENIFSIPGLGRLLVDSVNNRDYTVIQALILMFAGATLLSSLITDLLYCLLDPRIRL
jgi:peptide/nickel transport system permease protein